MAARLRQGGATIAGPFATSDLIDGEATLAATAVLVLAAGDRVSLEGRLSTRDGYFAADLSRLGVTFEG